MEDWRNERMQKRGGGCGTMSGTTRSQPRGGAPELLDPQTAALVRVAAALAEGKIDVLRNRMVAARETAVPDSWVEELLLQSLLVVGYPLALLAFGVWRDVVGPSAGRGGGGTGGGSTWCTLSGRRGRSAAPPCALRCTGGPITSCSSTCGRCTPRSRTSCWWTRTAR